MVDIVCYDPINRQWVVLEAKSGFTAYANRGSGVGMEPPLHSLSDSPANQHALQLAANIVLFGSTFGIPPERIAGWVLRVDDTGVTPRTVTATTDPLLLCAASLVVL